MNRVAAAYRRGSFFFEMSVDKLQYGGFLLLGVGSLNLPGFFVFFFLFFLPAPCCWLSNLPGVIFEGLGVGV